VAGRHSFLCHVDLDKVSGAGADAEAESEGQGEHKAAGNKEKSSKKRNRSGTTEAEVAADGALSAGGSAANFSMVDKYGPLLCAEFLTGHNLLLVERSRSCVAPREQCWAGEEEGEDEGGQACGRVSLFVAAVLRGSWAGAWRLRPVALLRACVPACLRARECDDMTQGTVAGHGCT